MLLATDANARAFLEQPDDGDRRGSEYRKNTVRRSLPKSESNEPLAPSNTKPLGTSDEIQNPVRIALLPKLRTKASIEIRLK